VSGSRLEPGARCLIVGEDRGYECNIGAQVTLVSYTDDAPTANGTRGVWNFEAASRPLLVGLDKNFRGDVVRRYHVTDSSPWTNGMYIMTAAYPPRYLMRIPGADETEDVAEAAPRIAETV
jgi:hypothetical protein